MIELRISRAKARSERGYAMGVVETDETTAVGVMQRERVAEAVRPPRGRFDALDREFDPVALFEVVHAAVEGEQKLKRVLIGYGAPSLSYPHMIIQ